MQLKSTHLIQFKSYFVVRTRDVQILRRLDIIFQMRKKMFDISKCSVFETLWRVSKVAKEDLECLIVFFIDSKTKKKPLKLYAN